MRKFVIIGVQGSGKGTQATLLCDDRDLVHISVGDIFRWNVQHHTKLGAQAKRLVAEGRLVDDDLVDAVVRDRLDRHDWNYGFVVDGFPRNVNQAELQRLQRFISAFQSVTPLTMGELWAWPSMLKLALIAHLRRLGEELVVTDGVRIAGYASLFGQAPPASNDLAQLLALLKSRAA